ncbi:hypothetical protein DDF62_11490 [Caulobacter radicis]|uniref:hypothetical protein n=1 Tax=Caulobacter radicis TaxID=2172650 RepID=UPI000D56F470|nr:hypothetical protein [Caulobacter radicis]PVM89722.1 hypothetical protein DDF62_11490 [Caulobacter radicis]
MRVITRREQSKKAGVGYGGAALAATEGLSDAIFDGRPTPREILARNWLPEGAVHQQRTLSTQIDSDRYLLGPQVVITRDDMRRVTWAAGVEAGALILSQYAGPNVERNTGQRIERRVLTRAPVWRYALALDKFSGQPGVAWIAGAPGRRTLWLDGEAVKTKAADVDFPFLAFSQVPVGRVQTKAPPFGVLGYKDRASGKLYLRRIEGGKLGEEQVVAEEALGGVSFAIYGDEVLARVDLLKSGQPVPALIRSSDGGRRYSKPEPIDLSGLKGFTPAPGYAKPIVDKGGSFHVPLALNDRDEALAVNYVVAEKALVEAIRVKGLTRKVAVEVFPSTIGGRNSFGNGVSDGHGLIMVLSTEEGQLFSSNSSAGGIYFPPSALLNYEMPLVAGFSASECYSAGQKANMVSMDYLFVESNDLGEPISSRLHFETWDMPLPLPQATATASGSKVELKIQADCDLEPGKVRIAFDDPAVTVTDVTIKDLRSAVIETDARDVKGKVMSFDVLTLFHRHHGEVVIH